MVEVDQLVRGNFPGVWSVVWKINGETRNEHLHYLRSLINLITTLGGKFFLVALEPDRELIQITEVGIIFLREMIRDNRVYEPNGESHEVTNIPAQVINFINTRRGLQNGNVRLDMV